METIDTEKGKKFWSRRPGFEEKAPAHVRVGRDPTKFSRRYELNPVGSDQVRQPGEPSRNSKQYYTDSDIEIQKEYLLTKIYYTTREIMDTIGIGQHQIVDWVPKFGIKYVQGKRGERKRFHRKQVCEFIEINRLYKKGYTKPLILEHLSMIRKARRSGIYDVEEKSTVMRYKYR